VALLWKMICNLGDPMSLRHPVQPFSVHCRWSSGSARAFLLSFSPSFLEGENFDLFTQNPIWSAEISNLKWFEQSNLPAKLPDCSLRSNKSNINQVHAWFMSMCSWLFSRLCAGRAARATLGCPHDVTVVYSLLHLECRLISISNLNLLGLFLAGRGKRDLEN